MTDISIFDDDTISHTLKIHRGDSLVVKNTGKDRWFKIEVLEIKEDI